MGAITIMISFAQTLELDVWDIVPDSFCLNIPEDFLDQLEKILDPSEFIRMNSIPALCYSR